MYEGTHQACAASTHWWESSWSPSAVNAEDVSAVSGLENIMASVSAHPARDWSGILEAIAGAAKFGVIGVA